MGLVQQPGFVGPSYTLRSPNFDAQKCINLYPELNEIGAGKNREVAMLVGTPGLTRLATVGGPWRGLFRASNAKTYGVSGAGLYDVSTPATPTLLQALTTSTGRVGLADNGTQLVLVDGAKGYVLTFATAVVAQITDPDFPPGANQCAFVDQYILFNEPGTGRLWWSALSDASNIDALDFSSAEGAPDDLVTFIVDHREVWLFGEKSTEVFFNSGDPDNPFQRIQGAYIEHGIAAGKTALSIDNTPFWVGADKDGQGMVWRGVGYQARRVSTHALEFAIKGYGNISGATAYSYQDGGHSFYVLNFPNADTTWVYDASTQLWHERQSMSANGVIGRHRGEVHCFDGTRHLIGDYETGKLYEFDDDVFTDDGQPIKAIRRSPHGDEKGRRIVVNMIQLDMETGVGTATGQGLNPQIMMRVSKNGGHSWSDERWVSAGKQGEKTRRAIWRRLGSARDWVVEVAITDPVKRCFISLFADVEVCAN